MASLAEMEALRSLMDDITAAAMNDLMAIWADLGTSVDPAVIRDTLLDVIPGMTREYAALASELSTDWYAGLDPAAKFTPVATPPPPTAQVEATVRWAVSPMFGVGQASVVELLAGGVQRHIVNAGREALTSNAYREGATWTRHANPNACGFCRVLATNKPFQRKPMKCHDWCKCEANVTRPGGVYERPRYVDQWEQDYRNARKEVGGGTNDIVNYLRRNGART